MNRFFRIVITASFTIGMTGCGGAYVADIAGDKITVEEFEQVYAKNNGGWEAASKTSVDDKQKFLDLYVKFRLKVKEAYAKGYDKDPELRRELADYRKNLAVSYMLEQEITKPALEQMYQRKLKEIRASHIMFRLSEASSPEDTAKAYAKALAVIDSLKKGVPFESLASNNSEDPSVQYNKGDLYYFSVGAMVPQFEDAVYSLKVGEYSQLPVRTQFGYHILKVADIQSNQGSVRVGHIMKRLSPDASAEDSTKAANELLAMRDSILKGGDFAEFARTGSDDTFSGQRGGDLGFIERGRTVREFDEAMYALKDGELSGIVKTQFGLHLVKRFETQGIKPYKELEQQLKTQYQSYRFQYDYDRMIDKIKKMYAFTANDGVIPFVLGIVDSAKTFGDATWDSVLAPAHKQQVVFTYGNQNVTLGDFISLTRMNPEFQTMIVGYTGSFATVLKKIGINLVAEYHAQQLENKFPDFARTMKEYEEGILLFKAEQEHVWNNVVLSDSSLRLYHARHSANYKWPDRVSFQEIFVPTDSIAKLVQKAITGYTIDSLVTQKPKGRSKKLVYDTLKIAVAPISFDSAAVVYSKRSNLTEQHGVWNLQPVTTNALTQRAWIIETKDSLTYSPYESGFSFIKVLQKDPAREKTFEEAQSEVSGAFQEYETKRLGDEWYESLKKKYPVTLNGEGLKVTFSAPAASAAHQSQ
ncbi:MAG: peptidylprolyl isomerase [Ignavibacteriales bacterium]|nr:peptidylprolyl isomerase [Ignavibacteriales bacterium]